MILFREFEHDDWLNIEDAVEPFMPSDSDFLANVNRGISVTAIEDGAVMACGGIVIDSDTEGTVWCKVSKKCADNPFMWARTIREAFDLMKDSVGDLRISTYILDGFCKGDGLARLIGLKKSEETEENNGNVYYRYTEVA